MLMNRNTLAAIVATIAVIPVVILGFCVLGGPGTQRMVQSDLRTIRTLAELSQQINLKWVSSDKTLPPNLESFPNSTTRDPAAHKSFAYRPKSNSEYELCATFATDSRDPRAQTTNDPWAHPKGDYCFQLDASQQVPPVPYDY
jgi:hypothetical protein